MNTKLNEWGYPVYDVLGRFPERQTATIALAKYNENPYDLDNTKFTFAEVYEKWYGKKYIAGKRKYSASSISYTKGAYRKCEKLHNRVFKEIRAPEDAGHP